MPELHLSYELYKNISSLPPELAALFEESKLACKKAYAPYSNFYVGAAVSLGSGQVIHGCNQENATYPAGLCAERTALYSAGAQYPEAIVSSIAITACRSKETLSPLSVTPCGGCRQVMLEFEQRQNQPIQLLMPTEAGAFIWLPSISSLLPFHFGKDLLNN